MSPIERSNAQHDVFPQKFKPKIYVFCKDVKFMILIKLLQPLTIFHSFADIREVRHCLLYTYRFRFPLHMSFGPWSWTPDLHRQRHDNPCSPSPRRPEESCSLRVTPGSPNLKSVEKNVLFFIFHYFLFIHWVKMIVVLSFSMKVLTLQNNLAVFGISFPGISFPGAFQSR